MEVRKKSILIALVIGDGSLIQQKKTIKGKTYTNVILDITHSYKQKEYIEWKANLCKRITGRKCLVTKKINKTKYINNVLVNQTDMYRFSCGHKYFRILRKWLYPNNQKKLDVKYLSFLDEQGLAIWYMDDGSTYIDKRDGKRISCELYTHTPLQETQDIIDFFQKKWGIKFNLHKKPNNQYTIRTFGPNAVKFIQLITPYVPDCMAYKTKLPTYYIHECTTSH